MSVFSEANGSSIIERESKLIKHITYFLALLVYNFSLMEPEYGSLIAKQLRSNLQETLKYYNVEILIGKDYLEVKNKNVNKEKLVKMILEQHSKNADIDFILYVGEDWYAIQKFFTLSSH